MSSDLQLLPDFGRRDYVVGLFGREIMGIGGVFCSANIVIVFNPVGILIAKHFSSYRFYLQILNKGRKFNDS